MTSNDMFNPNASKIFVSTFVFFLNCMTLFKHLYITITFGLGHVTALKYCHITSIIIKQ